MKYRLTVMAFVPLLVVMTPVSADAQTGPVSELYACDGGETADSGLVGVTVCDAMATPELSRRAEVDNLQVREGALVLDLESAGVSSVAGLQPGDMIYRVGGVDVTDAAAAAEALSRVGSDSDTVVNFLRGGRPYRVKLRQE